MNLESFTARMEKLFSGYPEKFILRLEVSGIEYKAIVSGEEHKNPPYMSHRAYTAMTALDGAELRLDAHLNKRFSESFHDLYKELYSEKFGALESFRFELTPVLSVGEEYPVAKIEQAGEWREKEVIVKVRVKEITSYSIKVEFVNMAKESVSWVVWGDSVSECLHKAFATVKKYG